jgi:hypothetical protein
MAGINEFTAKTTIRLVRHNSPPSGDYVHITGENTGCWSYVGRIGRVSNTVQGVFKKYPALRTALLGFNSSPNTKTARLISCYTTPPCEQFSNRPDRTAVTHSRTSCEFTNDYPAEFEIWFSKYGIVHQYVSLIPLVVQRFKWLWNTHLFMYLSVQRHVIHSS